MTTGFLGVQLANARARPRYPSNSSSGAFYDAPNQNDPSCWLVWKGLKKQTNLLGKFCMTNKFI